MKSDIRIVIADDFPIFRRGLAAVINDTPGMKVIAEAENGEMAYNLIENNPPDIAILDVEMPVMDGVEAAKVLRERFPQIKVIFLTKHKNKELLHFFKKLDVKGYVLKDCAVLEIVNCINQVATNNIYISPLISDLFVKEDTYPIISSNYSSLSKLTTAELRILKLISSGKTNKEIAAEHFISIRTVENHRFNICRKLDIKGNHSLLKFAIQNKSFILEKVQNE